MPKYMGPGGVEQDHPVTDKEIADWQESQDALNSVARRRRVEVYEGADGRWVADALGGTGNVTETLGAFGSKSAAVRAAHKVAREEGRVLIVDGEVRDDEPAEASDGVEVGGGAAEGDQDNQGEADQAPEDEAPEARA